MNRHHLRGTWEDDPAPLPFPGTPGRQAGATPSPTIGRSADRGTDADAAAATDRVIADVDTHLDRISYKIDELRDLLMPFEGSDPPPAA